MANFAPSPSETRGSAAEGPTVRTRDTIGELLRRTRQERGGEIEPIASALRIRASYIAAIEQARYDRLPGPAYALGFVRTYANHLGLDSDEAVRRFKLEAAGLEQRRDLAFPVPLTPRSIPGGRMLLAAFVLAVCAYGIWHYLAAGDRARPERVAAVPTDLLPPPPPAPAMPGPTAAPGGDTTAASGAVPASSPTDQGAASTLSTVTAAPAPAAVTATPLPPPAASSTLVMPPPPPPPLPDVSSLAAMAPPPPAAPAPPAITVALSRAAADPTAAPGPPPPHVYGAVNGPSRITIKAVKDCWIMVRDNDSAQTVVAQRTLHPGDTYRVPDRGGLVMRTGNAAGLEVMVDDRFAPALGGTVRNVALDPARLLAGNARVE